MAANSRKRKKTLAMRWRQWETAPKDGKHFIAWDVRAGMLFTMHWDGERFLTDYEQWTGQVTHWMPLPAPPRA